MILSVAAKLVKECVKLLRMVKCLFQCSYSIFGFVLLYQYPSIAAIAKIQIGIIKSVITITEYKLMQLYDVLISLRLQIDVFGLTRQMNNKT